MILKKYQVEIELKNEFIHSSIVKADSSKEAMVIALNELSASNPEDKSNVINVAIVHEFIA
jgi:hypothetical protein